MLCMESASREACLLVDVGWSGRMGEVPGGLLGPLRESPDKHCNKDYSQCNNLQAAIRELLLIEELVLNIRVVRETMRVDSHCYQPFLGLIIKF